MGGQVIGVMGAKGGGKNTVADFVVDADARFVQGAFADKMKAMALALDPWVLVHPDLHSPALKQKLLHGFTTFTDFLASGAHPWIRLSSLVEWGGWEDAKKAVDVRRLLQRFGTEMGRQEIGENFWTEVFHTHVTEELDEDQSLIITDVRFSNEIAYVMQLGGTLWRINGRNDDDTDPHPSEREWRAAAPHFIIENTGSLEDLDRMTRKALVLSGMYSEGEKVTGPGGGPVILRPGTFLG